MIGEGHPNVLILQDIWLFKHKNKGKIDDKGDNSLSMIPEK